MISVCMATCNGEHYIKQQIDSNLCQLEEMMRLIILMHEINPPPKNRFSGFLYFSNFLKKSFSKYS